MAAVLGRAADARPERTHKFIRTGLAQIRLFFSYNCCCGLRYPNNNLSDPTHSWHLHGVALVDDDGQGKVSGTKQSTLAKKLLVWTRAHDGERRLSHTRDIMDVASYKAISTRVCSPAPCGHTQVRARVELCTATPKSGDRDAACVTRNFRE